jgi:hypothetical protein
MRADGIFTHCRRNNKRFGIMYDIRFKSAGGTLYDNFAALNKV